MKKVLKSIATIVLLGAVAFLGGEWPKTATRAHVVLCNGGAVSLIVLCSLYLSKSGAFKSKR